MIIQDKTKIFLVGLRFDFSIIFVTQNFYIE